MLRLVAGTLWVLAAATTAYAELTLKTHPLAVTSQGSAAIVLEASSSHAAVQVFGPSIEGNPQTTSTVLVLQPGDWAERTVSFWSIPLTEAMLRSAGGPARLGVAVIRDDWNADLAAFPHLPTPTVRWLLHADQREAQALARELQDLRDGIGDREISYADYRLRSLEMFGHALDASWVLQVSSDGRRRPLPDVKQFPTPLGWLYRAMLDEAGQSDLAGCRFRPDHHAGAGQGRETGPWHLYSELIRILEKQRPNRASGSIRDEAREAVSPIWRIPEAVERLNEAIRPAPGITIAATTAIYAEFALMGDIDPAAVDIAACSARRLLAGHHIVTRSIRERSVIYGETDQVLRDAWEYAKADDAPPRFFAAASHVTRLFGVGTADFLHAYGVDDSGAVSVVSSWAVDMQCLRLPAGRGYLPTVRGREVLRMINEKLFDFVNLSEMRWLVANPGSLRVPDGGVRFATPPGVSVSDSLAFDLRMVLREQAAVQKLLDEITPALREDDIQQLTRSQQALLCLRFAEFARKASPEPYGLFPVLANVAETLRTLKTDGVIPDGRADFGNYWYRVATGMAYMIALHHGENHAAMEKGIDMLAELLRALIAEQRKRSPSVSALPPGIRREIFELASAVNSVDASDADHNLSAELERSLGLYMDPDLANRPLLGCVPIADDGVLEQKPLGIAADPRDRAKVLINSGLRPLAMAYELMPGGALDAMGVSGEVEVDAGLCTVLRRRRAAFAMAGLRRHPGPVAL